MKAQGTPLVEKEGIADIFSKDPEKQVRDKKITPEAKRELNKFKAEITQLTDTPSSVRDSEAILVAIRQARKDLQL